MSYQSKPTSNGVYRIKVLNQDLYIESVPGGNPGLKLASLSPTNNKQKWNLAQVSGSSNTWTIVSVEDQSGLTYWKTASTYWGYGYPYPGKGPSLNWSILERTEQSQTFSKIKLVGSSDCMDSNSGSDAVNFYYDQSSVSNGPKQCFVFELVPPPAPLSPLDVIFLQDATASQQSFTNSVKNDISIICANLTAARNSTPGNVRFGLIAFRDHPPQDQSFVTLRFPFTSDVNTLLSNLAASPATGGGGGPEAQTDALADALKSTWRDNATKVVVLITDSPPHGIGEINDAFPGGCPLQVEPLRIAKRMGSVGITLHVIACEPVLSQVYKTARSFYTGLAQKTGGTVFNIGSAQVVSNVIASA